MKLVPEVGRASPHCHIVVALAEHDSPAIRSQSDEYYKASPLHGAYCSPVADEETFTHSLGWGRLGTRRLLVR